MAAQAPATELTPFWTGRTLREHPFWLERRLASLARRTWLAMLFAALVPLIGRALLLPVLPIPKPAIQDEFSYLLAEETFASGHLANPTPPYAEHFETLEELIRPTYASKYPPFSGLVLAAFQVLAGQPWLGVWASMGVLCAALCWALRGWVPPVWALAGSLLAALRIGVVSYWTETYWGGTCAAIGGALVIGALPRLIRRPRALPALALAGGLAILANTRPYEGLVLAVPCLAYLAFALLRRPVGIACLMRHVVLPMAVVLVPVFAWMGYYNYRVTGHPLEMPYVAHEKQYAVWSPWLWQSQARPAPAYSNTLLEDFWLTGDGAEKHYDHEHLLKAHVSDLLGMARFFLGWPLVLVMAAFARPLWRNPAARCALLLGACFYLGCAVCTRVFPHYAAPATALVYLLAVSALRVARSSGPGSPLEQSYLTWSVIVLFVVSTGVSLLTPENRYFFGPQDYHVKAKRAAVEERLAHEPGRQLVLVSYGPGHDLFEELVYNHADILGSPIIWARALGPEKDQEFIRHFPDRTVWLLREDGDVKLKRYLLSTQSTTPTHVGKVFP